MGLQYGFISADSTAGKRYNAFNRSLLPGIDRYIRSLAVTNVPDIFEPKRIMHVIKNFFIIHFKSESTSSYSH